MTTPLEVKPSADAEQPWHHAFPKPLASLAEVSLASITTSELRALMDEEDYKDRYLVVDVRRTDFETAFIRGAINLPAHSFYPTLESLVPILSRYNKVIFHCNSSAGRGPRTAAWYQDRLNERGIKNEVSQAVVLTGGIKKWIAEYGDDEKVTVKL